MKRQQIRGSAGLLTCALLLSLAGCYTATAPPPPTPSYPEPEASFTFSDVAETDWFYEPVRFVVDQNLFEGTSATHFSPNIPMTRAMLVTVLYRMAGSPETSGTRLSFSDVLPDAWYRDSVLWATETALVTGYSSETFAPDDPLTREQLAVILYRLLQQEGEGFTADWIFYLDYPDAKEVSDWAYEAMCWFTMQGLITGHADGSLSPLGEATRAELATLLERFLSHYPTLHHAAAVSTEEREAQE